MQGINQFCRWKGVTTLSGYRQNILCVYADVDTLIEKKSTAKLLPEKALVPAIAALAVIQPVAGAALAVRQLTLNKKIEAQQYSCEITKFYIDSLSEFLGI